MINQIRIGSVVLLATAMGMASAQSLYSPTRPVKDQGITLKGWGSGTVAETDELAFEGTNSIRVSSRNFFQGGIISFANAISLSEATKNKDNLLYLTLQVPGLGNTLGGSGGGRGAAGPPGGAAGVAGAAGAVGTSGGGRGEGAGAGGGGAAADPQILKKVRVVITTSDGKKSEAYLDLTSMRPDAKGWFSAGVPLQAINGFDKTNKDVKAVAISGDTSATIYLGEMKVLNDPTPIYGETNIREMNLAIGDERSMSAFGYGGSSALRYTWDFDSTDGIAVDAEGQTVTRRFRKPGKYVITVTITDIYGLKKPFQTTINVEVNP